MYDKNKNTLKQAIFKVGLYKQGKSQVQYIYIESQPILKGMRVDLGDLALAAEGASPSISVIPRNAAALDRVPS